MLPEIEAATREIWRRHGRTWHPPAERRNTPGKFAASVRPRPAAKSVTDRTVAEVAAERRGLFLAGQFLKLCRAAWEWKPDELDRLTGTADLAERVEILEAVVAAVVRP